MDSSPGGLNAGQEASNQRRIRIQYMKMVLERHFSTGNG
jgi:hypothetical protein